MLPDEENMVTVFSTSSKGVFLVAKSILDGSGIEYYTSNEYIDALAYGGEILSIRVSSKNTETVKKLLEDIQENSPIYNLGEQQEDEFIRFKIYASIVLLIIVILIAVYFIRC